MTTLAVAKNEPLYKLEQAKLQENKSFFFLLQDDWKTGFIAGIEPPTHFFYRALCIGRNVFYS